MDKCIIVFDASSSGMKPKFKLSGGIWNISIYNTSKPSKP